MPAPSRPTIYQSQLIEAIGADTNLPKYLIEKALQSALRIIFHEVHQGKNVSFMGYGTFHLVSLPAKKGHAGGHSYSVPPRATVHFRPALKQIREVDPTKTIGQTEQPTTETEQV